MPTYLVAFRRNDRLGTEEYDGGHTIADARKEAEFFRANLPAGIPVRIAKVIGNCGKIKTLEVADSTGSALSTHTPE